MEQVSKSMIKELKKAHSLNEILESRNGKRIDYWYSLLYLQYNRFSDEAYLKIIKHINGDTQFEEEKPKNYVVRSKKADDFGTFRYLVFHEAYGLKYPANAYVYDKNAEKFDTREEAEKWTNPLMEVVEVDG